MSEQKENLFKVTDEAIASIVEICANKPYVNVFTAIETVKKGTVTETEGNNILNLLGKFPYIEVVGFFNKVNSGEYFQLIQEETQEETKEN